MKRKNLARASAAVLAVIMTVSGTTMTGFASGGEYTAGSGKI